MEMEHLRNKMWSKRTSISQNWEEPIWRLSAVLSFMLLVAVTM